MSSNNRIESPTRAQGMHAMAGGDSPSAGDQGSTRQQPAMTFSDTIDAIGMGPFQNRLVIMCGMVSDHLFPSTYTAVYEQISSSVYDLLLGLVVAGA